MITVTTNTQQVAAELHAAVSLQTSSHVHPAHVVNAEANANKKLIYSEFCSDQYVSTYV